AGQEDLREVRLANIARLRDAPAQRFDDLRIEADLPAVLAAGPPVVRAAVGQGRAETPTGAPLPNRQVHLGEPLPHAPVAVAGAAEAVRNAANTELRRGQQAALAVDRVVLLSELLVAPRETRGQRDRPCTPAVVRDTRHQHLCEVLLENAVLLLLLVQNPVL